MVTPAEGAPDKVYEEAKKLISEQSDSIKNQEIRFNDLKQKYLALLNQEPSDLENKIKALNMRVDALESDNATLNMRIDTLEAENATLKADISTLKADNAFINERIDYLYTLIRKETVNRYRVCRRIVLDQAKIKAKISLSVTSFKDYSNADLGKMLSLSIEAVSEITAISDTRREGNAAAHSYSLHNIAESILSLKSNSVKRIVMEELFFFAFETDPNNVPDDQSDEE